MKNNYKEYDRITLLVKHNLSKEIIEYYKILGWELEKEDENKRYQDIVDLTLIRPHKIENKDELQLLQVYMEERINKLSRLERHKHSFSTSYGLFFGIIGLILATFGVLFILNILPTFKLVGGIVFCGIGGLMMLSCAIFIPRIFKKEKIKFEKNHTMLTNELKEIFVKASKLTGGSNATK